MISELDIKQYFIHHADELAYRINDNDMIVRKETGEMLCSVNNFLNRIRKELHCDFECIYSCPATLQAVLKCRQCGAIIFASDSVDDYDKNLCCPVCANYDTHYKYYTFDDILKDKKKQEEIKMYKTIMKERSEAHQRYQKRGKYDHEIFKGRIKIGSTKAIYYCLQCYNLFKSGLKGLQLVLDYAVKDNDICYVFTKHVTIPLSYSAFKIKRLAKRRNANETLG